MALTVLLVTSLIEPVAGATRGGGRQVAQTPAGEVPPLHSDLGAPFDPEPVRGDFTEAGVPAPERIAEPDRVAKHPTSGFSKEHSQLVERTPSANIYRNLDGTKTAQMFQEVVNVPRDGTGELVPVDTNLELEDGTVKPKQAPVKVELPERTDADAAIQVVAPGGPSASLEFEGLAERTAEISGRVATYRSVQSDVDLELHSLAGGAKHVFVLHRAVVDPEWRFRLTLDAGLSPEQQPDGAVLVRDTSGDVRFVVAAPKMWDDQYDDRSGEWRTGPVSQRLERVGDDWQVVLSADRAWVNSPDRKFPIKVDPGLHTLYAAYDAYVTDAYPTTNYDVDWEPGRGYINKVGYWPGAGTNQTYAFYDFLPYVQGRQILRATWNAYWVHSNLPSPTNVRLRDTPCAWNRSTITWNNRPCSGGVYRDSTGVAGSWTSIDVTDWVKNYANGTWAYQGFMAETTQGQDGWKKMAAAEAGVDGGASVVAVDYNDWPSSPTRSECSTGCQFHTRDVTLSVHSDDPNNDKRYVQFYVSTDPNVMGTYFASHQVEITGDQNIAQWAVTPTSLSWNQKHYWQARVADEYMPGESWLYSSVWDFTPVNQTPPVPAATGPGDRAVVSIEQPALTANAVSDADPGDIVQYEFSIATGSDGRSGLVARSGWLDSPSWTVPIGVLKDGTAYTWTVRSRDRDQDTKSLYAPARSLRVDRRLGVQGPVPGDEFGPFSVNLANGNLITSLATPKMSTIGGEVGVSLVYNSQAAKEAGLVGSYFTGDSKDGITDTETPVLVRTDPQVSFNWGDSSPYDPVVGRDGFRVRWQGYIKVPTTGSYAFGGKYDDGMRVWIGDEKVFDGWTVCSTCLGVAPRFDGAVVRQLEAGTPYPIRVEYREDGGQAEVALWSRQDTGTATPVPASWLTPTASPLPPGWSLSADASGSGVGYTKAALSESGVTLTDTSGAAHTYAKLSDGGYQPPAGEYGTLSRDGEGRLTLIDAGGTTYLFGASGNLELVTSPADARRPAAARMEWTLPAQTSPVPRLTRIVDPVSQRAITLHYSGTAACGSPGSFHPVPAGYLCAVELPDGAITTLSYLNGKLARFRNPGTDITDFAFTPDHLMSSMRTPQAIDWIHVDLANRNNQGPNYQIGYSGTATRQLAWIKSPEPTGIEQVPSQRHRRAYSYGAEWAEVDVDGLSPTSGFHRRITRDVGGRMLTDTDATGRTARFEWAEDDKQLSTTDRAGRKSTTLFDAKGNPTETFGPAPANCFGADRRPLTPVPAGCEKVPTTRTGYDEGLTGLAGTWWTNPHMAGAANAYSTRNPNTNWSTTAPADGIDATGPFSGRMTGQLRVDTPGQYYIGTSEPDPNDGLRVYIDDNLVTNRTYSAAVLESKPIGYWRLGDSGASVKDVSGNDRNGTANGAVTRTRPGALPDDNDTSTDFAGGRVEVPGTGLTLTGAMTVEMWVKPRVSTQWGGKQALVNKIDHSGTRRAAFDLMLREDNRLELHQDSGNASTNPGPSTTGLGTNFWNHVVVTRDTDNKIVYFINGAKAGEGIAGPPGVTTGPLKIGFRDGETTGSEAAIDEVAVYDKALSEKDIIRHTGAGRGVNTGRQAITLPAGTHRIRLDYQQQPLTGNQNRLTKAFALTWKRDAGPWEVIPSDKFVPDYGLVTSTTAEDSDGLAQKRTQTLYTENGADPAYSVATASVADPDGLALTVRTSYETPGNGYMRRVSRSQPSGTQSTYTYYGDTETRSNPCVGGSPAVSQAGLAKTTAMASGRVDEQVYDLRGRVVARASASDWSCTTYDDRGRTTELKFPGNSAAAERTVRYDHTVGGDPLTTSISDENGTITSKFDLLGRMVAYTDVHGLRTETTYDQAGRVTQERIVPPIGPAQSTLVTYDDAGRALTTKLDEAVLASMTYNAAGELATVGYYNGTSLKSIGRNGSGRTTSMTWRTADGHEIVSTVTRTRSGTVVDETLNGVDARPGAPNYHYDAVGRLTEAWVAGHHYTYDFTSPASTGCPTNSAPNAGLNTNRVRLLDETASGTAETAYCYDSADRLLQSVGTGGTTAVKYDSHGNTTEFTSGGSTTYLGWDAADRNLTARSAGSAPAEVSYVRDATDRIVRRAATQGDQLGVALYAHTGSGDTADVVLDGNKNMLSRSITLAGGLLLTIRGTTHSYDHPTVRGDLGLTTDATGKQVGDLRTYTPFGEPLNAAGVVDPDHVPDNLPGEMDHGWLGQHQRPYEHAGALSLIQMGARPYSPLLGRFLSIDPVEGGSANDYDYVNGDPVNSVDLDGNFALPLVLAVLALIFMVIALVHHRNITIGLPSIRLPVPKLPVIHPHPAVIGGQFLGGLLQPDFKVKRGVVPGLVVGKLEYKNHAEERMWERGISEDMVEDTIRSGKKRPGNDKGTTKHVGRKIWVVTDKQGRRVVSVGWN
ncbi:PA14 domain-containing protein [Actinosynnema sp. NPDC050436]|uniref:PA14 domain-containing protein n=1 Tax=Actinosynnema sp. NPDC050436 TaxID=3155659 RepID=UPI0034044746